MPKVRVYVIKRSGSPYYQLKWRDPNTRQDVRRSSGTKIKRDAERQAAKIEQRFADGTYNEPQYTTWSEFRQRYEQEHLEGLAEASYKKSIGTLNVVTELIRPRLLSEIDAGSISKFSQKLRKRRKPNGSPISESTIKGHVTRLKAAMNWAHSAELIEQLPNFPKIARAKKVSGKTPMKGRPITEEEFDRICRAVPEVVGDRADRWLFLLRGLWFSGLRLHEALHLHWDGEDVFRVDMSNKYPMFLIRDKFEKGHRDRILPMSPEFAQMLQEIPERRRRGRIFTLSDRTDQVHMHTASRTIVRFGKRAGVKVQAAKFASAQDLRRSFGERWAKRVMPTVLQQLMRHESIETTMRYYVGKNAETIAETIYAAQLGNNLGNSYRVPENLPHDESTEVVDRQGD